MLKMLCFAFVISAVSFSCEFAKNNDSAYPSFKEVVNKLKPIDDLEILRINESAIAISGAYQGRVFTSTASGFDGSSYGYINWKRFEDGTFDTTISKLGGESRLWFGPEFGKYSIFFDPDDERRVENMKISPDLNFQKFNLLEKDSLSVTYGGKMNIRNHFGTIFNIEAKRKITLLTKPEVEQDLGLPINNDMAYVGFSTESAIKNIGEAWDKDKGLLCIWDLGALLTTLDNMVFIPLQKNTDSLTGYFTPVTPERLKIKNNVAYYKADAMGLNKIGVKPELTTNIMGSYSKEKQLLNIVKFTFENDSLYVNSLPNNKKPYAGDVTNIFNGEVNQALDRNWPFYEFETSSSAKELDSLETMHHKQTMYHFQGNPKKINEIAQKVLGVDLENIPQF
ncbi:MAG: DUF6786 family protein [Jejuia sp.]